MSRLVVNEIQAKVGSEIDFKGTTVKGMPGHVLQVKSAAFTDTMSLSVDTRTDVTNLSLDITPSSTSSKILIMATVCFGSTDANVYGSGYLMRDSTDIGVGTSASGSRQNISFPLSMSGAGNEAYKVYQHSISFFDSPNTTSQVTYKVQVRHDVNGTMYINRSGSDANADYGNRGISTLTIMEVAG